MLVERYYKFGSESDMVGLIIDKVVYDDEYFGHSDYRQEITLEEYEALLERFNDPNQLRGESGIVNEEGYRKYQERLQWIREREEESRRRTEEDIEAKIVLVVKKIKKLLALEVIDQEDIDNEIDLNNMSRYRDEIKKRLNQ